MNDHTYLPLAFSGVLIPQLFLIHKVRRVNKILYQIDKESTKRTDNIFRQLEALEGIYVDLQLKRSLPATRNWAASPDFLMQLVRYALDSISEVLVECGSGASTIVLARCAQINRLGHVYSLEHQPQYAQIARRHLESHGLSGWATVLDAPLRPHAIHGGNWLWYFEELLTRGITIEISASQQKSFTGRASSHLLGEAFYRRVTVMEFTIPLQQGYIR